MQDFSETSALSRGQLLAQLALGDARDRAFAMWALALRAASADPVVGLVRGEPDPGVRRALAVVLAGHGEIDLLAAMTRHDPNVFVRASTVQILMRFVVAGQAPWSLITERLGDAPEVRAAVFSQVDASWPAELRHAAIAALDDKNDELRREAFETCARLARGGVFKISTLRKLVTAATTVERTHLIPRWFRAEDPARLCEVLAEAPFSLRRLVLELQPDLARTALRPWLADPALYAAVEASLRLSLADESLAFVLVLTTGGLSHLGYVDECVRRLRELERAPEAVRSLLAALQTAHIAWMQGPNRSGLAVDGDGFDEETRAAQRTYAALGDELARLV